MNSLIKDEGRIIKPFDKIRLMHIENKNILHASEEFITAKS